MNNPNRGLLVTGAVIIVALIVIVLSLTLEDDNHQSVRLPNGALPPIQRAPQHCITSLGQVVTPTTGEMGACAPPPPTNGLPNLSRPRGVKFIDLSNNNPISAAGMKAVKSHGYRGVVLKINQA